MYPPPLTTEVIINIFPPSAAVSPNPEQHLGRAQLHHHLPGPHRHRVQLHVLLPGRGRGRGGGGGGGCAAAAVPAVPAVPAPAADHAGTPSHAAAAGGYQHNKS